MRSSWRAAIRAGVGAAVVAVVAVVAAVALAAGPRGLAQQPQTPAPGASGAPAPQTPATPDAAAPSQPPTATGQPPPTFRAGVNFVRVDAIVTNKQGGMVSDLKPEDFEVTEGGKPQKIETFKLVSLDGGLMQTPDGPPPEIRTDYDEEREAARDDVRLFAIFLDDYHVRKESAMVARGEIARFVETQLGPSDMIGIMYPLESIASLRMTRNHDAIERGLQQFEGRKYDYRARNPIEESYQNYPADTVEKIRNQVSLSALKGLILHLGGLKEGRKALILVSEGYSGLLPPQMRDLDAGLPGSGNAQAGDPNAGINDPTEDRAQMIAGWDMESDLRDVFTLANRNNVAIYSVDPRGLAVNEFGIDQNISSSIDRQYLASTQDTLRTLAVETDGRAIVNRNDLVAGMKQIVRDTSGYYLLGYNSSLAAADGKFHEIKVRVKRPGVDVRARKGYWALTRQEVAVATAPPKPSAPKPVENALSAAVAATTRSRVIRTWIGTERGDNGKTRVTFVWEPVPKLPGAADAGDQPARVSVIAAGSSGDPYFRGRVPDRAAPGTSTSAPAAPGAAAAPAAGAPVAGSRVTFDVPPGTMQLRLSVEGAGAGVLDSEVRDVAIPDLTAPQTALSTPALYRARTPREMQRLKADPQAVPSVGREFNRTDRLLIRVAAYGPGTAPPALTARLLSRTGQAMTTLAVTPPSDSAAAGAAAPGAPGTPGTIELPLAGLAPGDYVIEIDAAGDSGTAQELVAFHVTG